MINALSWRDVDQLAAIAYPTAAYSSSRERVFALLVDVADRYVAQLEQEPAAQIHPAPYVGGLTPMDAAMTGLRQAIDRKRDGRLPQYRA